MRPEKKRVLRDQAANEHRATRKLRAKIRLLNLLEEATAEETQEERELRRLREYLLDWKVWTEKWRPKLGYPRAVPYLDRMRPVISMDLPRGDKEPPNAWAMNIIDASVDDLASRPDGLAMRSALRARLLDEAVGAAVFRSGRLQALPREALDALADRAEDELVVIVKGRGLPL